VRIEERRGLMLAYLTLRRAALVSVPMFETPMLRLPRSRCVTALGTVTVVSVGPGNYLLVAAALADGGVPAKTFGVPRSVATVTDVSDQLVVVSLQGDNCPAILAKLCSLDIASDLSAGRAAVTRLGEIRASVWNTGDGFLIGVQRSLAACFWDMLVAAAKQFSLSA
jgi:heterotetrameric sarcosine oxidase gamma subunit